MDSVTLFVRACQPTAGIFPQNADLYDTVKGFVPFQCVKHNISRYECLDLNTISFAKCHLVEECQFEPF